MSIYEYGEYGGMILVGETDEFDRNLSQCHFIRHKSFNLTPSCWEIIKCDSPRLQNNFVIRVCSFLLLLSYFFTSDNIHIRLTIYEPLLE
jgi:hypothetical protein